MLLMLSNVHEMFDSNVNDQRLRLVLIYAEWVSRKATFTLRTVQVSHLINKTTAAHKSALIKPYIEFVTGGVDKFLHFAFCPPLSCYICY